MATSAPTSEAQLRAQLNQWQAQGATVNFASTQLGYAFQATTPDGRVTTIDYNVEPGIVGAVIDDPTYATLKFGDFDGPEVMAGRIRWQAAAEAKQSMGSEFAKLANGAQVDYLSDSPKTRAFADYLKEHPEMASRVEMTLGEKSHLHPNIQKIQVSIDGQEPFFISARVDKDIPALQQAGFMTDRPPGPGDRLRSELDAVLESDKPLLERMAAVDAIGARQGVAAQTAPVPPSRATGGAYPPPPADLPEALRSDWNEAAAGGYVRVYDLDSRRVLASYDRGDARSGGSPLAEKEAQLEADGELRPLSLKKPYLNDLETRSQQRGGSSSINPDIAILNGTTPPTVTPEFTDRQAVLSTQLDTSGVSIDPINNRPDIYMGDYPADYRGTGKSGPSGDVAGNPFNTRSDIYAGDYPADYRGTGKGGADVEITLPYLSSPADSPVVVTGPGQAPAPQAPAIAPARPAPSAGDITADNDAYKLMAEIRDKAIAGDEKARAAIAGLSGEKGEKATFDTNDLMKLQTMGPDKMAELQGIAAQMQGSGVTTDRAAIPPVSAELAGLQSVPDARMDRGGAALASI